MRILQGYVGAYAGEQKKTWKLARCSMESTWCKTSTIISSILPEREVQGSHRVGFGIYVGNQTTTRECLLPNDHCPHSRVFTEEVVVLETTTMFLVPQKPKLPI